MEIDFRNITFKDLEGNEKPLDMSKQLANYIYSETKDVEYAILAQDIYKDGKVTLTNEQVEGIKDFLKDGFKAFVQIAFNEAVEKAKQNDKE